MDKVKDAFIAVSDKSSIDGLLPILSKYGVKICATEGTAKYIKSKGFEAQSIVSGFDFGGRVKSLDRVLLARVLADRSKRSHLAELSNLEVGPLDLVIVMLYRPDPKNFPETMDIGGQTLIRAAIKNYPSVAVAFDSNSIQNLLAELKKNGGSISVEFRKIQAKKALKFIAERTQHETRLIQCL